MKTASYSYSEKHAATQLLLEKLINATTAHSDRQAQDPKNWGFAGDLERLQELLTEAFSPE